MNRLYSPPLQVLQTHHPAGVIVQLSPRHLRPLVQRRTLAGWCASPYITYIYMYQPDRSNPQSGQNATSPYSEILLSHDGQHALVDVES